MIEVSVAAKDWVDYLAALLTPTIAVVGIGIAVLQWKTNRNRLKHELFDRRYEQFVAVRDFLGSIMGAGKALESKQTEYLLKTRGLQFIYDQKLADYLYSNIWCPAIDLACLQDELEGVPVGEERSKNVGLQSDIKKKLHQELRDLDRLFSKYLQLRH